MDKMLRRLKWTEIIEGALTALAGLACVIFPDALANMFSFLIGAVTLIIGIFQIVQCFLEKKYLAFPTLKLVVGVVFVVFGAAFLLHRSAPITIFAAITGIVVLVLGAVKMNEAIKARERKKPFLWLFIQSALHIAFGFLLVINPTSGTSLWIVLMGCYLIYLGLTLVITAALSKYELMR